MHLSLDQHPPPARPSVQPSAAAEKPWSFLSRYDTTSRREDESLLQPWTLVELDEALLAQTSTPPTHSRRLVTPLKVLRHFRPKGHPHRWPFLLGPALRPRPFPCTLVRTGGRPWHKLGSARARAGRTPCRRHRRPGHRRGRCPERGHCLGPSTWRTGGTGPRSPHRARCSASSPGHAARSSTRWRSGRTQLRIVGRPAVGGIVWVHGTPLLFVASVFGKTVGATKPARGVPWPVGAFSGHGAC